jgi:hypothetical protein
VLLVGVILVILVGKSGVKIEIHGNLAKIK